MARDDDEYHLQRLPDELRHLAVLRVLVAPDDKVEHARGVPEHAGRVRLRHPDQRLAVHLDDLGSYSVVS